MSDLTLKETLLAKAAYTWFLAANGVTVTLLHADNWRYTDKGFVDNCVSHNQTITFCGVGVYYQNRVAKRKIKSLTSSACTLLLHAKRLLPEYISAMLWPSALKCYEDQLNNLLHSNEELTPYQKLTRLNASPVKIKDYHTVGCPSYVLGSRLKSRIVKTPKWEPQVSMGI